LQGVHTRQDACQHGVCSSSYPPKDLLIKLQPDGLTPPQVGLERCQSLGIQAQGRLHLWPSWIILSRLCHIIVSSLSAGPAVVRALLFATTSSMLAEGSLQIDYNGTDMSFRINKRRQEQWWECLGTYN